MAIIRPCRYPLSTSKTTRASSCQETTANVGQYAVVFFHLWAELVGAAPRSVCSSGARAMARHGRRRLMSPERLGTYFTELVYCARI